MYTRKFRNVNEIECKVKAKTGHFSPHSFIYFDHHAIIQKYINKPIIHHASSNHADKSMKFNNSNNQPTLKYSTTIPLRDLTDKYKFLKKYWWLQKDANLIKDFRRRSLFE